MEARVHQIGQTLRLASVVDLPHETIATSGHFPRGA
jgi:hypothetical protein